MIISPEHKFIFFKSQKTAGSSIGGALAKFCSESDLIVGSLNNSTNEWEYKSQNNLSSCGNYHLFHQHCDPEHFFNNIKDTKRFEKFDQITIVRNPWDVVISHWFYVQKWMLKKHSHLYIYPISEGFNRIGPDGTEYPVDWVLGKNDTKQIAVSKFKKWCTQIYPHKTYHSGDKIVWETGIDTSARNERFVHERITNFIRYEHLEDDYKIFLLQKNLKFRPLPRFKTNKMAGVERYHYSYYYDKELINLVREKFPKTINKFGYEFERRNK